MTRKLTVHSRIFSVVALLILSTLIVVAQNPVPFVNQPLVPDAVAPAPPGGPGFTFTLTVNGTGFVPGSKVNWNGSPRTTAFVNSSRLIAFILSSDILAPTTAWITVVNPAPGGGTSNMLFLPVNKPTSTVSFGRTDYSVGANPQFGGTADFNRDGKLDLVVANYGSGSITVLMGNGDGTFGSRRDYPIGPSAQTAVIGDFNGDGILDLAVPYWPGTVAILLGNGDGTFRPAGSYPIDPYPNSGITADFNGDVNLDLVFTSMVSDTVSVLLGNGDGTFQPYAHYAVGEGQPVGIAVGDFNRDGKLDLATCTQYNDIVSILRGNGDGTFQPHVDYHTGYQLNGINVADLNGDGKLDLVVNGVDAETFSILFGNGDGTFRPPVDYHIGTGANWVTFGDFNQDGKLDMAIETGDVVNLDRAMDMAVGTGEPSVYVYLGNGDGTFQPPLSFPTGGQPWLILTADFNGDGHLDLLTSNWGDGTVSVLLQQPVAVSPLRSRVH